MGDSIMIDTAFDDEQDWTTFGICKYLETFLVSPLMVMETLVQVQFQPRPDSNLDKNNNSEYIPRLQGDFAENLKIITASQGFSVLAKGHLTHFSFKSLFSIIQPSLEQGVNDFLDILEDVNPWTFVISHAITGALLCPLELVRTRLVVSTTGKTRRYYGPFHAFFVITQEEKPYQNAGILSTLYHSRVLIPSILVHTLFPILRITTTTIVEDELGLDQTFDPILYRCAMIIGIGFETLILTPFEFARKRLFTQRIDAFKRNSSENDPEFPKSIETSPEPYTGIFNCMGAVISEEGGRIKKSTISTQEWASVYGGASEKVPFGAGIFTLFRGFWPRYVASVIEYASTEINQDY